MAKTVRIAHIGEAQVSFSAETLEDLFAEIAREIARAAGGAQGQRNEWEQITVGARDRTTLVADWANELLGRSEVESRAYGDVRNVTITERADGSCTISADVRGTAVKRWISPLKAATYHNLSLERVGAMWRAVILFDV